MKASTDMTYCLKECKEKCFRHESNYEFEENKLYIFTNECIKVDENNEINNAKK